MTKRVGDYELDKLLGVGSYAQVYRGRNMKTGQLVAIKMIARGKITDNQTDLEKREIPILKMLDHDNIVKLLDIQKTPNNHYLVMELCKYGDLDKYIKSYFGGRLPEQQARKIMLDIIQAYGVLYKNNIIHRDLKLANILVGDGFVVKLADFGFARVYDTYDPKNMSITVGTPLTSAPEILLRLSDYDYKCDMWSLGVILFQLVVGVASFPFTKDYKELTMANLLQTIQKNEIYYPSNLMISKEFKDLVRRMLVWERDTRLGFEQVVEHPWVKGNNAIPQNLLISSKLLQTAYENKKVEYKQDEFSPQNKVKEEETKQQQQQQQSPNQISKVNNTSKENIISRSIVLSIYDILKKEIKNIFELMASYRELSEQIETNIDLDRKYLFSFIVCVKGCQLFKKLLQSNITLINNCQFDEKNYEFSEQKQVQFNFKQFLEFYGSPMLLNEIENQFQEMYNFMNSIRSKVNLEFVRTLSCEEILSMAVLAICENTALHDYLMEKHEVLNHYKICKGLTELIFLKDLQFKITLKLVDNNFNEEFSKFWEKLQLNDENLWSTVDISQQQQQQYNQEHKKIIELKQIEYEKNDGQGYEDLNKLYLMINERLSDINHACYHVTQFEQNQFF